MNYSHVIETLKEKGISAGNIHVRKIAIGKGKYDLDGIECYVQPLFLRDKAAELRLALPDCKVYFSPNHSKIYIEER